MKRRLIIPALVLTAGIVYAIGMIKPHVETQSFQDEVVEEAVIPEEPEPSRAEQVVKALAAAYPLRIEQANFQNDDWAVLGRVEEKILEEAKANTIVRQWIDSLGTVDAWSWRDVASSGNRSYHAYGVAIDLLPRNLGGLETYWLWASQRTPEWWAVPYSRRYHPPEEVIRTFESFGFIWGGKWPNYDTMHFEYRPEIFILSGLEVEKL